VALVHECVKVLGGRMFMFVVNELWSLDGCWRFALRFSAYKGGVFREGDEVVRDAGLARSWNLLVFGGTQW
jgi:hypothetical protein